MRKGLVYAEFPAPYRVAVFEVLAKEYQLDVFYEYRNTEQRSKDYAVKGATFDYYFLPEEAHKKRFDKCCWNLREYDFVLDYNAGLKNGALLALAAKLQGVPYFINNDGGFVRPNLIKDIIKKIIFRGASLCFAAGGVSKEYFEAYGVKEDRICIHNFTSLKEEDVLDSLISKSEKTELRKQYGIPEDKTVVITVGQFIPRKGFDLLLKAWKDIKGEETHLYIIGGGSGRADYEAYIQENGINNVSIVDFLPKSTLFQYYQASDIFVLPTREDVWGLVINEAMSQGLPVIATEMCLAAKELVQQDENGYLYAVNDTKALTGFIDNLIFDETLRISMGTRNIEKMKGQTMADIGYKHIEDIEAFFNKKASI